MIHIDRLPKPNILVKKEVEWTVKFLKSGKKRPQRSQYAHKEILDTLKAMSNCKCFYCERPLKGEPKEVDHNIEVSIDPSKAFSWDNLYLSCHNCNDKLDENKIPRSETLDPCADSNAEIQRNIYFVDEIILPYNDSEKGKLTIQKYKLGSEELDYKRLKWLHKVSKEIDKIRQSMISEGRKAMTQKEKNTLKSFTNSLSPYSYMCKCYFRANNIQL